MSHQTVSNWETGMTSPTSRVLDKLSQIYGVSVGVLLGEPQPPTPEEKPPEPEAISEPRRGKRPWVYVMAALALAAAIAVGGFLLWKSFDRSIPIEEIESEEVIEPLPPALPLLPPD